MQFLTIPHWFGPLHPFGEMAARWRRARCPYYNMYPSIIPLLCRVSGDLPLSYLKPPLDDLLIRLPAGKHALSPIESILLSWHDNQLSCLLCGFEEDWTELWVMPRTGTLRTAEEFGLSVNCRFVKLFTEKVTPLIATLCLMSNDPSVIEPDVLSKDRARFDATYDLKYVERAHRRKKIGWIVGRRIDKIPHYRRPHFAIRWTGKGRTTPRLTVIKSSIVHRRTVEKVPTGYETLAV